MLPASAAEWYSRLAALTRAGITIPEALRTGAAPDKRVAAAIADRLENGGSPREAWGDYADTLGKADAILLAAGQLSGKFPETCDALCARHTARAKTLSKLAIGAAYPLIVLHALAFLAPFTGCFNGQGSLMSALGGAALTGLLNVALIWVVIGGGFWLARRRPTLWSALIRPLPFWGASAHHTALATFCGALASMLRAGILIGDAWRLAGEASGEASIRDGAAKVAAIIDDRRAPGAELSKLGVFPDDFCALYFTGERIGGIERQLDTLTAKYDDIAVAKATKAAIVYPVIIYAIASLGVAAKVIGFWAGYFQNLIDATNTIR